MSSISVAGDVSGAISIAAPSAAGSGVLTLPTGTDTLVGKATTDTLTNKSIAATQLTGTIAASVLPAGSVLQVVNGTYSTQTSSSSNAFADTGLTATITPTSASSKILAIANQAGCGKQSNNTFLQLRLLRNATVISNFEQFAGYNDAATNSFLGSCGVCYLDSPATTSATTYKTQLASGSNIAQVFTQTVNSVGSMSTITLMEIAG